MSGGSPQMPEGLAAALQARLEGRSRQVLRMRAQQLSERYRAHKTSLESIQDEADAFAYALTRMPATFAAVSAVLTQLSDVLPVFVPRRLIDIGCGLGAASYAALRQWPELESILLLDHSPVFLDLARHLAEESSVGALKQAFISHCDMRAPPPDMQGVDLAIAAYSFTELADDSLLATVEAYWRGLDNGVLIIVEPGTTRDYARLMRMRDHLIAQGGHVLAPCPHDAPCPLINDWCHFFARVSRSKDHRLLKDGVAPFEDEKFSYLIVGRVSAPRYGRLIARPRATKPGIVARICSAHGIAETFTPRRDKSRYDKMKRKEWGDPLDAPQEESA